MPNEPPEPPPPSSLSPMMQMHPSNLFTGRDKYLQRLRDYFSSSTGDKRKAFLLYGLGGIGKTQICLKFIEENENL